MFITSRSKGSKRKTVLIIVIRYDTFIDTVLYLLTKFHCTQICSRSVKCY